MKIPSLEDALAVAFWLQTCFRSYSPTLSRLIDGLVIAEEAKK